MTADERMVEQGWIGVDLDGTLAEYHGWMGIEDIGKPVPVMVQRVQDWLKEGRDVRIFTARIAGDPRFRGLTIQHIDNWCKEHIGTVLPITNMKDLMMIELWDDRCVTVELNTGRVICHPIGQETTP